jgi:hypothetical protein
MNALCQVITQTRRRKCELQGYINYEFLTIRAFGR